MLSRHHIIMIFMSGALFAVDVASDNISNQCTKTLDPDPIKNFFELILDKGTSKAFEKCVKRENLRVQKIILDSDYRSELTIDSVFRRDIAGLIERHGIVSNQMIQDDISTFVSYDGADSVKDDMPKVGGYINRSHSE